MFTVIFGQVTRFGPLDITKFHHVNSFKQVLDFFRAQTAGEFEPKGIEILGITRGQVEGGSSTADEPYGDGFLIYELDDGWFWEELSPKEIVLVSSLPKYKEAREISTELNDLFRRAEEN